jgi:hypothetical protein
MSTIVHYECRNLDHLRAGSRRGNGGLVIHHGSVGYCDGLHVDGAHRWVPTGGVPIEFLYDSAPAIDPRTYRGDGAALGQVPPSASGTRVVDLAGGRERRRDARVGAKLSDDPEGSDEARSRMSLLHAD